MVLKLAASELGYIPGVSRLEQINLGQTIGAGPGGMLHEVAQFMCLPDIT
jgi:hypothetical protein